MTAAAAVVGSGCTDASSCPGGWCGTVVVASPAQADILLPPVSQSDVGRAIVDLVFLKLADIGPALNTADTAAFVPKLAASWVFEDPRTLVFTLRPEARWHDGPPVTADDVLFTFDVYRDTLVASPARPRLSRIDSVTVRDVHTVVFHFSRAYPEQLFDAVYHLWVIPKHLLDTVPRATLASHPFGRAPIGAGPYRFVSWTSDQSLELAADSSFFGGRPGIRRVIWRFAGSPPAALTQLAVGEADLLTYLWTEAQQQVAEAPDLRTEPYRSSTFYNYLAFNLRDPEHPDRPHPLFGNRALRRAITMAVDRTSIIRAVDGRSGTTASGPLSPAYWISGGNYAKLPFDSARARRELQALGWQDTDADGVLDRDGAPLSFTVTVPASSTPRRRMAVIAQEQLSRIGVQMRIAEVEFGAFLERADAGSFDVLFGAYMGDPSPSAIAEVWSGEAVAGFNYGHYVNPEFDRAVAEAIDATDLDAARSAWTRAITVINEDAPAIWMSATVPNAGIHRRLAGVTIRGDNATATLADWSVPTDALIDRDRFVP